MRSLRLRSGRPSRPDNTAKNCNASSEGGESSAAAFYNLLAAGRLRGLRGLGVVDASIFPGFHRHRPA
jgi:hypothetical protein